ncbi:MAG: hypothetical protein ACT4QG_17730 [Sporichthyaceae bacterium]
MPPPQPGYGPPSPVAPPPGAGRELLGRPLELCAAVLLFGVASAVYGLATLFDLPDAFKLVGDLLDGKSGNANGRAVRTAAFAGLAGFGQLVAVAASLGTVTALLWQQRRVARGLAWALTSWFVLSWLLSGAPGGTRTTVACVACTVGTLVLLFAPAAKAVFDTAPHPSRSSGVLVLQVAFFATAVFFAVSATQMLFLSNVASRYYLGVLVDLAVAAGCAVYGLRLVAPDRNIRFLISGALVVALVLHLLIADAFAVNGHLVAAVAVTMALLWLSPDARAHFGEQPLDWRALVGRSTEASEPPRQWAPSPVPAGPPMPPPMPPMPPMPPPPMPPPPPPPPPGR